MASESLSRSSQILCRPCFSVLRSNRSFSSTAATLAKGPESPDFVYVPQSLQQDAPQLPHVKGFLPVPRKLFSRRRVDKPSAAYLMAATKEPSKHTRLSDTESEKDYRTWKRRMATMRRQNLREGLIELFNRKIEIDKKVAARGERRQAQREHSLYKPLPRNVKYTRPSIPPALLQSSGIVPDPNRDERIASRRENVEDAQTEKQDERQEALHSLYMNARNFITSEAQLDSEIERVFGPWELGSNPDWSDDVSTGRNIWNMGTQPTVQKLLSEVSKSGSNVLSANIGDARITRGRVRKIEEELTGGKL
ncbi:MAG: hypothetical protein M1834_006524 [Cirrosporium novae-zelandiae]|nr:MAG: hypothetical protein M1834_006524 [Cirrosporium novae-zelandiae]